MDIKKYQGVIPAFYACYDDNGSISPERTRALARYLLEKGVKGLYVGGSSGECIYDAAVVDAADVMIITAIQQYCKN